VVCGRKAPAVRRHGRPRGEDQPGRGPEQQRPAGDGGRRAVPPAQQPVAVRCGGSMPRRRSRRPRARRSPGWRRGAEVSRTSVRGRPDQPRSHGDPPTVAASRSARRSPAARTARRSAGAPPRSPRPAGTASTPRRSPASTTPPDRGTVCDSGQTAIPEPSTR
jgi:hypothetical protein